MRVYPIHRELITEWNGLLVPAAYDCDIFLRVNRDANATAAPPTYTSTTACGLSLQSVQIDEELVRG